MPINYPKICSRLLFYIFLVSLTACPGFFKSALADDDQPYSQFEVVTKINQIRQQNNLSSLSTNPWLNMAAENKASDMVSEHYFSHNSPDKKIFSTWPRESGYQYSIVGENLAFGYTNLNHALQAWLNSPSHKANILEPLYLDTGVAIKKLNVDHQTGWLIVQIFGRPMTKTTAENYLPYQQSNQHCNQLQGLV